MLRVFLYMFAYVHFLFLFFFNYTATTEIYTLSLHDALPISTRGVDVGAKREIYHIMEDLAAGGDRKSTRLNSSHGSISYAGFCLKKEKHCRTQVFGVGSRGVTGGRLISRTWL